MAALDEKVVVDGNGYHTTLKCGVVAKDNQDRLPTYTVRLNFITEKP